MTKENDWFKRERIRAEKEKTATKEKQVELFINSQKALGERKKATKKAIVKKKTTTKKTTSKKKTTKKSTPKKKKNGVKTLRKTRKATKSLLNIFR